MSPITLTTHIMATKTLIVPNFMLAQHTLSTLNIQEQPSPIFQGCFFDVVLFFNYFFL